MLKDGKSWYILIVQLIPLNTNVVDVGAGDHPYKPTNGSGKKVISNNIEIGPMKFEKK